ncbi:MAG: hypothetical protein R3244_07085 [Thermoanaerobaculia bacterium]|nr:hypothetical protein [Thermoanaerobaculia bacterium]
MTRRACVLIALASWLSTVPALPAAESELVTRLEPAEITVGDRSELLVELRLPAGTSPRDVGWPSWEQHLGEAEILAVSAVESSVEGTDQVLRQLLTLTLFRTGSFTLPAVAVSIAREEGEETLTSSPGTLEVVSVLPPGEELPEAKPPAPPRPLAFGARFWWLTASLAALCLAGLVWLASRERKSALDGSEPRLPPLEELTRTLEGLRRESDAVALHAGASLALRRYLGRRLGFTAPESTTTEVDRALRRRRLETGLLRRTIELLTACDMVKFARQEVDEAEARDRLDRLEALARRIEEWLQPQPDEESPRDGQSLAEAS